jgi:DNA modification methylase
MTAGVWKATSKLKARSKITDSLMQSATLYTGDAKDTLASLPAKSVQTCVTSPPYWGLRDYGEDGQLGLEETPEEYVQKLVDVFSEVRRVLRDDGTVWLNLGDSYASGGTGAPSDNSTLSGNGHIGGGPKVQKREALSRRAPDLKEKDLTMIPSRVAMALQEDGWWVRSRIVWAKGNPMPESVTDRPTSSHEYIFLLSKSKHYYYDADSIREEAVKGMNSRLDQGKTAQHQKGRMQQGERTGDGTRNKRDVWQVNTKPFPDAHFAVYPPELIEPCVNAGSAENDTVLDPFSGAGTTGVVALAKARDYIGIDLSQDYNEMAADRIRQDAPLLNTVNMRQADIFFESGGGKVVER